ncbi:hypothetical protein M0813_22377 [Anaeramoeba flamelloides]|uniref:Uncharacterized protein n=1 Tax=Anaeramoeba flamelloides TaxID=1746091 RepID=A0ABQ8YF87_9EUKA|nr:hypothetical protein M0813_22377 [Anaeramoeba flamelloides]
MSISTFLKTHPKLNKIKNEFQTLKSYNSRFQTLMNIQPESFSGLYAYQLEKEWIKGHRKLMSVYGPHKVKIKKDCLLDLSYLTNKSKRTIERGINTFFKKNFNLQNCSNYSRDWLTYKLTTTKKTGTFNKIKGKDNKKKFKKRNREGKRMKKAKRMYKCERLRKRKRKSIRKYSELQRNKLKSNYKHKNSITSFKYDSNKNPIQHTNNNTSVTSKNQKYKRNNNINYSKVHSPKRSKSQKKTKKSQLEHKPDESTYNTRLQILVKEIPGCRLKKNSHKKTIHTIEKKSRNFFSKKKHQENFKYILKTNNKIKNNWTSKENEEKILPTILIEDQTQIFDSENLEINNFYDSYYEHIVDFNLFDNGTETTIKECYDTNREQIINKNDFFFDFKFENKEHDIVFSNAEFLCFQNNFSENKEMDSSFTNFFLSD